MKRLLALAVALAAPAVSFAQSTWILEPTHTHSSFTIRHLVISNVRGEFGKTTGTVKLDDKDVTKSTRRGDDRDRLDRHPRRRPRQRTSSRPDFFDAAKYPTITFKSTKVEKAAEGKLKVTGDLTIKGVTKPVVLDVAGPTAEIKDP